MILLRHWRTIALMAALAGAFGGGWWACSTTYRIDELRATVRAQDAALRASKRNADTLRAYNENKSTREAAANDTARALQELEGRDAPLSDHMRDAASQLWP